VTINKHSGIQIRGTLKICIMMAEGGIGCAMPYINDLVFSNTKKKHRYIHQANAHLRAAESQSEKQSCDLLVLVIQFIFYD